jgi:branched-chain amino acid transport system substrate-binding protein
MTAQLREVEKAGPQALICWGTPPGAAIVARQMRQLGMEIALVCSHGVANQTFIEVAGEAAEGVVLPAGNLVVLDQISPDHAQTRVLEDYAEGYRMRFRRAADPFGGYAWDALQLLVRALRVAGPDRNKIRDAIEQTNGFVGTTGVFDFSPKDHNGLSKESFAMVEIVEGEWRLLK